MDVSSPPAAAPTPEVAAVGFVAALRRAGVPIPVGATVTYTEALAEVGLSTPSGVYWAGRATLLVRPEDIATYDETFAAFWGRRLLAGASSLTTPAPLVVLDDGDDEGPEPDHDEQGDADRPVQDQLEVRYSPTEVLRHVDFATATPEELAEIHRLMESMRAPVGTRPSRRHQRSPHGGRRPDLRRTLHRSLRTGGEAMRPAHTSPSHRPRRLVLLVDVSGSMEPYARSLLRFVHAASTSGRKVDAFAFGTRLTRLTREMSSRDPDSALAAVAEAVQDWAGGTRLGDVLAEFNERWGVRGMARGAVVVILSDGWDRGDPATVAEQMQRLARVAHRVVWVNPLKATPDYQPLARGMAAALPHVDRFIEGHSLAALETLAQEISS